MVKEKSVKKVSKKKKEISLATEREIAADFANKVYTNFDKLIKSIILFGSSTKQTAVPGSDIDIIIITDDVAVKWDQEMVLWYREELERIVKDGQYVRELHINTVKLSTWWQDLLRGDPVVLNVIRYGDPLIDNGGFFIPLKVLLQEGKIRSTPESISALLQRAPQHISRTKASLVSAIDGLYWALVDSAHAALISARVMPPSPEHIAEELQKTFVEKKMLDKRYVHFFKEVFHTSKEIVHGKRFNMSGKDIDSWIKKTNGFIIKMSNLVDREISRN